MITNIYRYIYIYYATVQRHISRYILAIEQVKSHVIY